MAVLGFCSQVHEGARRRLPYGGHFRALHGEAYRIWLRRSEELADSQPFGMSSLFVLEDDVDKAAAFCSQMWRMASRHLTRRQMDVLRFRFQHDMTKEETAQHMRVTGARIAQIETKALRVLRELAKAF